MDHTETISKSTAPQGASRQCGKNQTSTLPHEEYRLALTSMQGQDQNEKSKRHAKMRKFLEKRQISPRDKADQIIQEFEHYFCPQCMPAEPTKPCEEEKGKNDCNSSAGPGSSGSSEDDQQAQDIDTSDILNSY